MCLVLKTWPLRLKWSQSLKNIEGLAFGPLRESGPFPEKRKWEKILSTRNNFCPGQHLRAEPVVEKADFCHPAPSSFSFYLSPESFARSGLSLGSWPGNQACLPCPEADRRGQIGDEVTWDACEEGREP